MVTWGVASFIQIEVEYVFSDDDLGSIWLWAEIDSFGGIARYCKLLDSEGKLQGSEPVAFAERGVSLFDWVANCIERTLASDPTIHADAPAADGVGAVSVWVDADNAGQVAFGKTDGEVWFDACVERDVFAYPSMWAMAVAALRFRWRRRLRETGAR